MAPGPNACLFGLSEPDSGSLKMPVHQREPVISITLSLEQLQWDCTLKLTVKRILYEVDTPLPQLLHYKSVAIATQVFHPFRINWHDHSQKAIGLRERNLWCWTPWFSMSLLNQMPHQQSFSPGAWRMRAQLMWAWAANIDPFKSLFVL